MTEIIVRTPDELARLIARDTRRMTKRVMGASRKAAARGRGALKKNIPVAHGELREAVHVEGALIVVDAPHAAAVNNGSRPHYPPLGPLIAWVKLRGMQGLASDRQLSRLPGTSTAAAARGVASMLAAKESGGAVPVDAAEQVARAIQRSIGKHGTKPHHFVEKTMPELRRILDEEIRRAMGQSPEAGDVGDDELGPGKGGNSPLTTGPRGGVFYTTTRGTKVYVKRDRK